MRRLLTVQQVRKIIEGANLDQTVTTTSPAEGGKLKLEAVSDFSPRGGLGVFEPGSSREEAFSYSGVDEATDELLGMQRNATKFAHSAGTFVQAGQEKTVDKVVDGLLDDSEIAAVGVPVPPSLYPYFKVGHRDNLNEVVAVEEDEDGELRIVGVGVGAVPHFDEDLEVLPAVGGGDASTGVGGVQPPGMGFEDGLPPSASPTPIVAGGVGSVLFIRFPTIKNNSIVKYKVHVHTTSGFAPATNTLVGTVDLAGTPGFDAVLVVKDFPAGHVLDGTVSDPPQPGTTYFAKIVASDGSGDGPASAQGSGTPIKVATADIIAGAISADLIAAGAITSTKIEDGAISTPKLAAGAVTAVKITAGAITANEIAAGTITGDRIAGLTITGVNIFGETISADKLSTNSITSQKIGTNVLSAISIDASTITGTTITGATITGGVIRTAATGDRIEINGTAWDRISFFRGGGAVASITSKVSGLTVSGSDVALAGSTVTVSGRLVLAGTGGSGAPLQYADTVDTASNPGVGAGIGQALPGAPAVWFRVITPVGGVRWIPTW